MPSPVELVFLLGGVLLGILKVRFVDMAAISIGAVIVLNLLGFVP